MPAKDPCSKLAATITRLAMNVGERPGMDTIDKVVAQLQKDIPTINRDAVVSSIVEATTGYARASSELADRLNALKREARSDAHIRARIVEIEGHLKAGTVPSAAPRPDRSSEAIKALRALRSEAAARLRKSEPARLQRVLKSIEDIEERMANGVSAPVPKAADRPVSRELDRAIMERDRLRSMLRAQINALRPVHPVSKLAEPFNLLRAIKTSYDVSAPLRQGVVLSATHPVAGVKAAGSMFRALVDPVYAHKVNLEIRDRPNAPMYAWGKLYLAPDEMGVHLTAQEESFLSRLAGHIPGVKQSQRAYVTFLNQLRADVFDTLAESLARNGEVTVDEARVLGNYINVATGRGNLGTKGEQATELLNAAFFAPKYVASRFQMLAAQPLWHRAGTMGHTMAARKLVAQEYVKFLVGSATVLGLANAMGARVGTDPTSSDFLKIIIGSTRIDLMGGMQQAGVFAYRMLTGKYTDASGRTQQLNKPPPYGMQNRTRADVALRFARTKLSPAASVLADVATGKTMDYEPVTPLGELKRSVMPMGWNGTLKLMEDQGIPRGTAIQMLQLLGAGVQTHDR